MSSDWHDGVDWEAVLYTGQSIQKVTVAPVDVAAFRQSKALIICAWEESQVSQANPAECP